MYFTEGGHGLGERQTAQEQVHGSVQFDGAWLHIRPNGDGSTVTVPAHAVGRVEWTPAPA